MWTEEEELAMAATIMATVAPGGLPPEGWQTAYWYSPRLAATEAAYVPPGSGASMMEAVISMAKLYCRLPDEKEWLPHFEIHLRDKRCPQDILRVRNSSGVMTAALALLPTKTSWDWIETEATNPPLIKLSFVPRTGGEAPAPANSHKKKSGHKK